MKKIRTACFTSIALLLCCSLSFAQDKASSKSPFVVTEGQVLKVLFDGKPFIEKDGTTFGKMGNAVLTTSRINGVEVFNAIDQQNEDFRYRREVALWSNRFELTMSMRQEPYAKGLSKAVMYSFHVPLSFFSGTSMVAYHGMKGKLKVLKGKIQTLNYVRHASFKRKDGTGFTIDTNPTGEQAWSPTIRFGEMVGNWSMRRQGKFMEFYFLGKRRETGGVYTGKLIFYPRPFLFSNHHKRHSYLYQNEKDIHYKGYDFGSNDLNVMGFDPVGVSVYDNKRGMGWSKGDITRLGAGFDVMGNGIFGKNKCSFKMKLKPGFYLFAMQLHNIGEQVIEGRLSVAGKERVKMNLAKGKYKRYAFGHYVKDGNLSLDFAGQYWGISGLTIEPLVYTNEDFSIGRSIWLAKKIYIPVEGNFRNLMK